ncbi:MAG TPA: LpxL/LpxP family Kdo(2)-lipid IV(A) lauroyl/palmitoleoyl acyltransferase [Gammaproteobacteria bacterium]|nr:LpxL/LpxP family Kdo(2)-lipid IV(A) lauroyl/palmitoleoyl acyltransferase [Gammaproteobacteria bacterium]
MSRPGVESDAPLRVFLHPRYWVIWLMAALLRLMVLLPYPGRVVVGNVLGVAFYRLMSRRKRVARINLELCFPELSTTQRERLLKAHFAALGVAFVEMGAAWWASDRRLEALAEIEGLEYLEAALKEGKGAILLSAHFVFLEIGLRLFSRTRPCYMIYRPNRNPLLDRIIQRGRTRHPGEMISRDDARSLLRALKQNQPVWYPPDMDHGRRNSVFADFFGQPAATVKATARYAKMSGSPVIPFYFFRKRGFRGYKIVLLPPLEDFPSGDELKDARRVNAVLESEIRKHPEQYLWAHRRFKTRPDPNEDVYRR